MKKMLSRTKALSVEKFFFYIGISIATTRRNILQEAYPSMNNASFNEFSFFI